LQAEILLAVGVTPSNQEEDRIKRTALLDYEQISVTVNTSKSIFQWVTRASSWDRWKSQQSCSNWFKKQRNNFSLLWSTKHSPL